MAHAQIQLPEEQVATLKQLAKQRQISLPDLIQEGIDALLQPVCTASKEERKKRAIAISGRFRSGLSDLSQRHDVYFTEALGS